MKLGFDIDGITANMAKAMVERMNSEFNLDYDVDVFKDHNIHKNTYVDDPEQNKIIAMDMRTNIIENPDAVSYIEVYEDAVEAIKKLSRQHTIHHITARHANQQAATVDWFRKNRIPFDTVHVIGKDGPHGGKISKGKLGRSMNLDFFLDDFHWHLADMYRYKNRWRKGLGLFTRPWNEGRPTPQGCIRFDNWPAIIRHLGIQKR